MKKMAIGFAAMAALIGVPVIASAQSTEAQSTDDILRRLQALEASNAALAKENATLRLENTKLRGRVSEQKGSNETVTAQQTSTTSASTLNRTSSKVALYDKASMVVKAPPPAPVPVYSWTGFYAGGNIGYSWGNANTDVVGNGTQDSLNLAGFGPMFISNPFDFAASNSARPNGVIGGGQIGYNYQFSPNWVLGFEADIQGSGQRGSGQLADPFSITICRALSGPGTCAPGFLVTQGSLAA
jgi:opacity protein-like surface antigen